MALFASGQRVTAATLNRLVPLHAAVTVDQGLASSSTTLQDVTELAVTVAEQAVYDVTIMIGYAAGATGDVKIGWGLPSSSTIDLFMHGLDTSLAVTQQAALAATSGQSRPWGGVSVATVRFMSGHGRLVTAGFAGTFKIQAAQNTSTAEVETIKAGSYITLRRVA